MAVEAQQEGSYRVDIAEQLGHQVLAEASASAS
jgi:hypothetical protein